MTTLRVLLAVGVIASASLIVAGERLPLELSAEGQEGGELEVAKLNSLPENDRLGEEDDDSEDDDQDELPLDEVDKEDSSLTPAPRIFLASVGRYDGASRATYACSELAADRGQKESG